MTGTTDEQRELDATARRTLRKLRDFVQGLPDDERNALAAMLGQAETADLRSDDTAGYDQVLRPIPRSYGWSDLVRNLGEALGFRAAPDDWRGHW